ncbi:hypothetical protein EZV62_028108 [Acer yangbiense]|uniref:NB-ARC domain-containing protein n=1 Tax=Acer yangbiense TaxID=1000413 RepID=A0A5C7GPE8_9ROSI|nr:hypothetical protein EZV62_028108 [Acer yangbiense]
MALYKIWISRCSNLKSIPDGLNTLRSLREISVWSCQDLVSFPKGGFPNKEGFPANLSFLKISSPNLYKPPTNLGFHNLTSLKELNIHELADAESFHEEEMEMTFPPTLTSLSMYNFPKLKCLSCKSLENLTSLEYLWFINCPELTYLPNLPSSLLRLYINGCPLLKEACKRDKGKEWYKIADIPYVQIDEKFIYDP